MKTRKRFIETRYGWARKLVYEVSTPQCLRKLPNSMVIMIRRSKRGRCSRITEVENSETQDAAKVLWNFKARAVIRAVSFFKVSARVRRYRLCLGTNSEFTDVDEPSVYINAVGATSTCTGDGSRTKRKQANCQLNFSGRAPVRVNERDFALKSQIDP